jgi:hypothetical protein
MTIEAETALPTSLATFPDAWIGSAAFAISSYCHHGGCVAVATLPDGGRAVRDAKASAGPVLAFTAVEWDAFVKGVKAGEFD